MRLTIAFLALIGVLSLSGCKFFEKHRLFSKDVDTLLDVTVQEPVQIIDTTPVISAPIPAPVMETSSFGYGSDKYYMIVGSFQNKNFAEKYAEKVQQMGYQTKVIESQNGFYRVSAKSYVNFKQGIGDIDGFRSDVSSQAWLHVKR